MNLDFRITNDRTFDRLNVNSLNPKQMDINGTTIIDMYGRTLKKIKGYLPIEFKTDTTTNIIYSLLSNKNLPKPTSENDPNIIKLPIGSKIIGCLVKCIEEITVGTPETTRIELALCHNLNGDDGGSFSPLNIFLPNSTSFVGGAQLNTLNNSILISEGQGMGLTVDSNSAGIPQGGISIANNAIFINTRFIDKTITGGNLEYTIIYTLN